MQSGCLQIYTGNGKGKTTASLGLICRALGHQRKICLIQFMKKNFRYGEIQFLQQQPNIDIFQFGTAELIDPSKPAPIDFSEAKAALAKATEVLQAQQYDLIVIDEINVALYFKLIPLEPVLELAKQVKRQAAEVVFTGRYAAPEIIEIADLVTEMKEIKHYYVQNIPAREGVEF